MFIKFRQRLESEKGFTLIELLVVILIIGILAAIALPAFLGQRAKGQDSSAKSDARNMVSQVESCFTGTSNYAECENGDAGLEAGGLTSTVTANATSGGYSVTATSESGNTFTITKSDDRITRGCDTSDGTTSGGCDGTAW